MYQPLDESLCQTIEVLDRDSNTKLMANRLVTTTRNFNQISHSVSAMQLLKPHCTKNEVSY